MLKLKNITKTYIIRNKKLNVLTGINIEFRKSEFVSILGPSGCGKTTLLNIIGGLDRYTTGDLILNGKSTKYFNNNDWDSYRNYSVGFVFQSYNLIPHQTILSNVELALIISGVSKKERKKRAIQALEEVGLKNEINKKPNQLSGGQLQRVAIARALVNNPDIILADEPTGALDTKTSVQVMKILKNISKNKLVIMVTHNPTLAQNYSSRIVQILDGKIIDDSNPTKNNIKEEQKHIKNRKKPMKFLTALNLSLNNLWTKKGRTILTSIAGSIGIIGIALILAISTGVQNYIDKIEKETLLLYPLIIENSNIGNNIEDELTNQNINKKDDGKIYSYNITNDLISFLSKIVDNNNLKNLKEYIESGSNKIKDNSKAILYNYDLNINLYKNTLEEVIRVNPSTVMEDLKIETSSFVDSNILTEMIENEELLKSQYDLVAGNWPTNYNEVVLIVEKTNEISDYMLSSLGLKVSKDGDVISYSYEELLNLSYKLVLNSDYYVKYNNIWIDKSNDEEHMKKIIKCAEEIKVVGIVKFNDSSVSQSINSGIGYTSSLKNYVINKNNSSKIVQEQKNNANVNIFTGLKFSDNKNSELNDALKEKNKLNSEELAKFMENYTKYKDFSYENNLLKLGYVDLSIPNSISVYPNDFASKEILISEIKEYNEIQRDNNKEENVINYNDDIGTMMNSVSQIIDIISYVLISFVSISLIVSSIMIGIITYISVLERTKEIGILRAIGASKKDVSRVFNAETLIVGFISGIFGILITMLFTLLINILIDTITEASIIIVVPISSAIILIVISVLLTIVSGLIPARLASKKDPAESLRTE